MLRNESDAALAAFIGAKGITRCPTACAVPTQATITAADRIALEDYASKGERRRERGVAAWRRFFRIYGVPASAGK